MKTKSLERRKILKMTSMRNLIDLIESTAPNTSMEKVWYHGSARENPRFSIGHTGTNSTVLGDYKSKRYGIFLTDNPEFAALYGDVRRYRVNVSNVLRLPQQQIVLDDLFDSDGFEHRHELRAILYGSSPWWLLFEDDLGETVVAFLIDKGFDGALFKESNKDDDERDIVSTTLVVFDTHKIRQYNDPDQPDLFDESVHPKSPSISPEKAREVDGYVEKIFSEIVENLSTIDYLQTSHDYKLPQSEITQVQKMITMLEKIKTRSEKKLPRAIGLDRFMKRS